VIRSGTVQSISPIERVDGAPVSNQPNVEVLIEPLAGCSNCSSSGGCGVQLLQTRHTNLLLHCQNAGQSQIFEGDRVRVCIAEPDSGWLRVVFMAYGLPTIGMIAGTAAGYGAAITLGITHSSELTSLLGFALGLAGGLIAWNRAEKSMHNRQLSQACVETATIVGVVANSGERI